MFIVSENSTYKWQLLLQLRNVELAISSLSLSLNKRQTKIVENSTIHFFWKCLVKKKQVFGESFKLFDPPTTKWRSFKFFVKLNEKHILMDNFSKFCQYQTFGFIELSNLSKDQLSDTIFKLWKSCVYDYRVVEHTTFEIPAF